jgi:hypothetical protein
LRARASVLESVSHQPDARIALFADARPGLLEFNPLAVRAHGDIHTARNIWVAGQFRATIAGTKV